MFYTLLFSRYYCCLYSFLGSMFSPKVSLQLSLFHFTIWTRSFWLSILLFSWRIGNVARNTKGGSFTGDIRGVTRNAANFDWCCGSYKVTNRPFWFPSKKYDKQEQSVEPDKCPQFSSLFNFNTLEKEKIKLGNQTIDNMSVLGNSVQALSCNRLSLSKRERISQNQYFPNKIDTIL